jgi:hypothetical protein
MAEECTGVGGRSLERLQPPGKSRGSRDSCLGTGPPSIIEILDTPEGRWRRYTAAVDAARNGA